MASLNEVVSHVKTDLMPDFDYEEFDRRQAEWEAQNKDAEDDEFPRDESGQPEGKYEKRGVFEKAVDVEMNDETEAIDEVEKEEKDDVKIKDEDDVEW